MKILSLLLILTVAGSLSLLAQVKSITLAVQTHCPYGIKGCWAEIRDGLQKPYDILAVVETPNEKASTCEVMMKDGWLPNPEMFAQNFANMRIGVDVLGVEATAEGTLTRIGTNLVLNLQGIDQVLYLAPLTKKVQWNRERKEHWKPTSSERRAYSDLAKKSSAVKKKVRITGPLFTKLKGPEEEFALMEVRQFQLLK